VARISPATGQLRAGPVTGTTITDARPPEIGEVAASADGTRIALVSRRDALDTPAQVAVDLFGDPLAQVAAGLPAPLEEIRTATGIAWVAGRAEFVVGAVSESTGVGGRLVAFSDSSLAPGTGLLFTSAAAAPAVGSAAGVSVAGVGDRVAVAWTDWRTCSGCSGREIFLTIVDASGGRPFGEVQVSEPSTTPKSFPKVVFDGAALAVAWLEYQDPDRSDVKLRRFDDRLGPAGPILGVGPVGQPRPASGDIDLAAAAPGDYAVVMSIQTGRQSLTRVTCAGTGN
jgi:hypothetical protein